MALWINAASSPESASLNDEQCIFKLGGIHRPDKELSQRPVKHLLIRHAPGGINKDRGPETIAPDEIRHTLAAEKALLVVPEKPWDMKHRQINCRQVLQQSVEPATANRAPYGLA